MASSCQLYTDGSRSPSIVICMLIQMQIDGLRDSSAYSQGEVEAVMDDLQSDSNFSAYANAILVNVDRLNTSMAKYWKTFMDIV